MEHTRKITNSTFSKQKRFKNLDQKTGLFILFFLINLIYIGYYLQLFITNVNKAIFERKSTNYCHYTSKADYLFYSGLASTQQALLNNQALPLVSKGYFEYYKDYFHFHYNTYADYQPFHHAFTETMMTDVCNGFPT